MLKRRKARALHSLQDRQAALAQEQLQHGFEVPEPQAAHSRLAAALDYKDAAEIRANIIATSAILAAVAACEYLGFSLASSFYEQREWLCLLPGLAVFAVCCVCLLTYLGSLEEIRRHSGSNLLDRGLYVQVFDQTLTEPAPRGIWASFLQRPRERMLQSDSLVQRITALVEYYPRLASRSGLDALPQPVYLKRLGLGLGVGLTLSLPLLLTLFYLFKALAASSYWAYGSNYFNIGTVLAYIVESGGGLIFLPVLILVHAYLLLIGLRLFAVVERAAVRQSMNAIVNS